MSDVSEHDTDDSDTDMDSKISHTPAIKTNTLTAVDKISVSTECTENKISMFICKETL